MLIAGAGIGCKEFSSGKHLAQFIHHPQVGWFLSNVGNT